MARSGTCGFEAGRGLLSGFVPAWLSLCTLLSAPLPGSLALPLSASMLTAFVLSAPASAQGTQPDDDKKFDAAIDEAYAAWKGKEWGKAKQAYVRALRVSADWFNLHRIQLAYVYVELKDAEEGLKQLETFELYEQARGNLKWAEVEAANPGDASKPLKYAEVRQQLEALKKGDKTPGVKRQWCGTVGKTENCIVTVHLGYATGDFHCLLDGELFLPEDWAADRARCRKAGIPDDVVYRAKWRIALDLHTRAKLNGVVFEWLTFDEGYGGKPAFLRELDDREQWFVGEVPTTFTGWVKAPRVTDRPFRRGRGRGRKTPRLIASSRPAITVENMLKYSPELRDQPWVRYHVKDTEKGPHVWEVKHTMITIKDEQGLPGVRLHLVVARNVLDPQEIKFFVSNAPAETPVETLLLVGFSRWRVERCFEDQKQEVGLDQWEGRRWLSLKRHLIVTAVSYLFLARVREGFREKKSGAHRFPGAHGGGVAGTKLVAQRSRVRGLD